MIIRKVKLSILIPVYNYDVRDLVHKLHDQLIELDTQVEILCYDDASTDESYKVTNREINKLSVVIYKELPANIGRAAIRNKLANEANYNKLLFIDCDCEPISDNYLKNYLGYSAKYQALSGGTIYPATNDNPKQSLRWKYGIAREEKFAERRNDTPYDSITLNNFYIDKSTFLKIGLDESIEGYGHEDTKFGYALNDNNIPLLHIRNPVLHYGLETNEVFLQKTETAIKNFYKLSLQGYGKSTKLYESYLLLKSLRMDGLFISVFSALQKSIIKNLCSSDPSLQLFDLYKLKLLLEESRK